MARDSRHFAAIDAILITPIFTTRHFRHQLFSPFRFHCYDMSDY